VKKKKNNSTSKSDVQKQHGYFKVRYLLNKWWFWLAIVLFTIFVVFVVPVIINEAHKSGKGYYVLWYAADVLSYWGSVLAFVGTVLLGIITISLTRKANDTNDRLFRIEAERNILDKLPFVMVSGFNLYTLLNRDIFDYGDPKKVFINVSHSEPSSEPHFYVIACVSLTLINTSSNFVSVRYWSSNERTSKTSASASSCCENGDNNDRKKIVWNACYENKPDVKLCLQSGEIGDFVFYAPEEDILCLQGKEFTFCFSLENRFGKRYSEYIDITFHMLQFGKYRETVYSNCNGFMHLTAQNYRVFSINEEDTELEVKIGM
jgi:hypothetical protein